MESSTELVCKNCGKNPGHNDVGWECYECGKAWCDPVCDSCGETITLASRIAGECVECSEPVD